MTIRTARVNSMVRKVSMGRRYCKFWLPESRKDAKPDGRRGAVLLSRHGATAQRQRLIRCDVVPLREFLPRFSIRSLNILDPIPIIYCPYHFIIIKKNSQFFIQPILNFFVRYFSSFYCSNDITLCSKIQGQLFLI